MTHAEIHYLISIASSLRQGQKLFQEGGGGNNGRRVEASFLFLFPLDDRRILFV